MGTSNRRCDVAAWALYAARCINVYLRGVSTRARTPRSRPAGRRAREMDKHRGVVVRCMLLLSLCARVIVICPCGDILYFELHTRVYVYVRRPVRRGV